MSGQDKKQALTTLLLAICNGGHYGRGHGGGGGGGRRHKEQPGIPANTNMMNFVCHEQD